MNPEDICPRPDDAPPVTTRPMVPPIYLSAVYKCSDPDQADRMLGGQEPGYVYVRDSQPNADLLAEKCRELHAAEEAAICGSGMGALAAALLSQLKAGDHAVISRLVYGKSRGLFVQEGARLGIETTLVDSCDLAATRQAMRPNTRLLLVETLTNPRLRVSNLPALAEIALAAGAQLLVDNTFAGPVLCRPLEWGADLVMESLTKTMNGHSDVLLGLLAGRKKNWDRVKLVISTWGLSASPFDCYLATRGLGTLALRMDRACDNAQAAAQLLAKHPQVAQVDYPGLDSHPDHALARQLLGGRFGTMVTFTLKGGQAAANTFISGATQIPFSPSLGDLATTLSHPVTTSHRGLSEEERAAQGILPGTIRLSLGIESAEHVCSGLQAGLAAVRGA